ncbi:MAG: hypothetical protein ACYC5V_11215 [Gemmatimonadaceae bacterium]
MHRLLITIAALLVADGARAQQADTTDRPFVRGGAYDKPFQHRLAGRAVFGGYAEAHWRHERADGAQVEGGFEAKRFNLFANARVSDFVRFAAELEFEEGGREVKLEFAAMDLRLHPALSLRGGMILSPLGRFNLAHDSPLNEFTDRPLVSTEIIGVALSEPGIGAFGRVRTGGASRLTWELYATNGFSDSVVTASEAGTRIPAGRGNFEDNNASPAVVGRVAWSPRLGTEFGLSAHRGQWNTHASEGVAFDRRRSLTIVVLDIEAEWRGVVLQGEAATAAIELPGGMHGIYASRQAGGYVEIVREFARGRVRTMPQSSFAAKARFDAIDLDRHARGDAVVRFTAGLTFRPTRDSAIKFDVVRGRDRDQFNNPTERAAVLVSLTTYF